MNSLPIEAQTDVNDIRLINVSKSFGGPEPALSSLTITLKDRELLVLLGPSGCGKTTLLNILAGLEEPSTGENFFGKECMTGVPAEERNISMVFQSIGLYPHMNAIDNIRFPLKLRRVPREKIAERVEAMAKLLGISHLMKRRMNELSGGERQRVAIAKALVKRPRLFLLDEAFSNLDADRRRQLRSELVRIHQELDITMVFVTHDQEEAMSIADRIAVMRKGRLIQIGTPLEIYQHPVNLWVAQFIGSHPINVINGQYTPETCQLQLAISDVHPLQLDSKTLERWGKVRIPNQVILGIRPEWVRLSNKEGEIPITVTLRQVLGENIVYHLSTSTQVELRAVRPASDWFEIGQAIFASFSWERVFVFDQATESALL